MKKKRHILIICTGNTCRSPMAEGWLRSELKRQGRDKDITVSSCGVFGRRGAPASFEAELLLKNEAIDISRHKSQPLTKELVESATHIIAMNEEHKDALLEIYPKTTGRLRVFTIEDPIGQDLQVYKECYEKIKAALKEEWNWLTK